MRTKYKYWRTIYNLIYDKVDNAEMLTIDINNSNLQNTIQNEIDTVAH